MTRFLAAVLAALGLAAGLPAQAQPVKTPHVTLELVAQTKGIAPGGKTYVALNQQIQSGWHTYWRNSGDSGAATEIHWTLPDGWTAGDIVWAPPTRQPTGPLMNYGYHDQVLLPVAITAPSSAKPGQTINLKAHVSVLVCADVCVPQDADLTLDLAVTATPTPDQSWGAKIAKALNEAPKRGAIAGVVGKTGTSIQLALTGPALAAADMADAYFYPFAADVIDHAKPQIIERGPEGLTLSLTPTPGQEAAPAPKTLDGVLVIAGHSFEINATAGVAPAGARGLGTPPPNAIASGGAGLGLFGAVAFAFVGGLILNLMPCVFPVLAMKAASLAGHAHERDAARSQGLAFLAGVLATFLTLAVALIAVRAGGAAVGWGFQLQSPPVVAVLALLMLAVALNLSGLFEIGGALQGVGSEVASRDGLIGAFFTGALAVVVAAPCTAPFMAPALGWALTQSAPAALAVFLGLGLGFAAPFTLAAFVPALLSRLPRPGPWMDGFRKLMAFPMYGAAAWLAWVLVIGAGSDALARLFAAAVILALAIWIMGIVQRRHLAGGRPVGLTILSVLLLIGAILAVVVPGYAVPSGPDALAQGSDIPYEVYSPEKLAEAQAEGKPVFVNFTAAWCVTCQVNEKVAFSTKQAAEAFTKTGTVYLKADWTRRDAVIAQELAKHGRAGVPLYLVYSAKGGEPQILPQILTGAIVAKALDRAAAS